MFGTGIVIAAAVAIGVVIAVQPRYGDLFPMRPDDLDTMANAVAGTELTVRVGQSDILTGTSPAECGIVAQIGTGLWSASDVASGAAFYQLWGSAGGGAPWVNARLFASPEQAAAFLDDLATAASLCADYRRPDDATVGGVGGFARDGDTVRFTSTPYGGLVVVARHENAVILLLFEDGIEDPSYAAAIPGATAQAEVPAEAARTSAEPEPAPVEPPPPPSLLNPRGGVSLFQDATTYQATVDAPALDGTTLRVPFEATGPRDLRTPENACVDITPPGGPSARLWPTGVDLWLEERGHYGGVLIYELPYPGDLTFEYGCNGSGYSQVAIGTYG